MKRAALIKDIKHLAPIWACLALCLLLAAVLHFGCGLETDKANKILESALTRQEKAEAAMQELATFPPAWEVTFDVSWVGPEQVEAARALVVDAKGDLQTLMSSLEAWETELKEIEKLNVGDKIKKYVELNLKAIDCNLEYAHSTLAPLLEDYGALVEMVAQGRPLEEKNQLAEEISVKVAESAEQREECRKLHEEADRYFVKEQLGDTKESQRK